MIEPIDWGPVARFVRRRLSGIGQVPTAGSPDWLALDDADPKKLAAVLTAGSRWCLEWEIDQIHNRAVAEKDAALELSTALPWAAVAKSIAERDAWYRAHPDLKRKKAS